MEFLSLKHIILDVKFILCSSANAKHLHNIFNKSRKCMIFSINRDATFLILNPILAHFAAIPEGKPLLFHDKCPGFFYVHYTTHGTYTFTSHPKDEAIMVKCLAQRHNCRDQPDRDSNPHSDNTRT